ncbi:hypothetical protein [Clostridium saccharoperbutylacetonicum]
MKFKLRKVIASLLIATSILAISPIGASAEWKSDNNGWWYAEGNSYATGWKKINGKYYFFSKDGYMVKNNIVNTHILGNDGSLIDTQNQAQVEKMMFLYPSNWIKSSLGGKEIYYLDNAGTNVSLRLVNMQGKTPEEYINAEEAKIKSLFKLNYIEGGYVELNHNKAKVAHYSAVTNDSNKRVYSFFDVTFFNNNTAYMFTLIGHGLGNGTFSDETLHEFEDLLRTVEFSFT